MNLLSGRIFVSVIFIAPLTMRGDVMGITAGSSATPALGQNDLNYASTINVSYQTFCTFLLSGAQATFPATNFTFAGYGNIGGLFSQIVSSDINVSVYQPWVVNNFANPAPGANTITDPSGRTVARNVQNQDAGGADVVIN